MSSLPTSNSFLGGGIENLLTLQLQSKWIDHLISHIEKINLTLEDGYLILFYKVISLIGLILIVMVMKNLITNSTLLTTIKNYIYQMISILLRYIFYKKYTLVLNQNQKYSNMYKGKKIRDYVLHRAFQEKIFKIEIVSYMDRAKYYTSDQRAVMQSKFVNGFPIYYYATEGRISDNIEVNYEFIRIWHNKLIKEAFEQAITYERNNNNDNENQKIIKIAYSDAETCSILYNRIIPDQVYESHNLKKVGMIVNNHMRVSQTLNMYHPLVLLIDGEPGLGKTRIADYMVKKNLGDNMYIYDMTKFRDSDVNYIFDEIKTEMNRNQGLNIILLDEVDKYLDYYIKKSYEQEKDRKIKELISIPDMRLDIKVDDVMKSKEEYEKIMKQYFLFELLNLIDARANGSRRIFIFCSNNFNSIFENVDMTHFKSLYDRLIKFQFNKLNKTELYEICEYYSHSLQINIDLNSLFEKINDTFEITIRAFHHKFISYGYDLRKTLQDLS